MHTHTHTHARPYILVHTPATHAFPAPSPPPPLAHHQPLQGQPVPEQLAQQVRVNGQVGGGVEPPARGFVRKDEAAQRLSVYLACGVRRARARKPGRARNEGPRAAEGTGGLRRGIGAGSLGVGVTNQLGLAKARKKVNNT